MYKAGEIKLCGFTILLSMKPLLEVVGRWPWTHEYYPRLHQSRPVARPSHLHDAGPPPLTVNPVR
jgi:hypothetical protein